MTTVQEQNKMRVRHYIDEIIDRWAVPAFESRFFLSRLEEL